MPAPRLCGARAAAGPGWLCGVWDFRQARGNPIRVLLDLCVSTL
ncbi:hypothetical protein [Paraburkholderia aromaticivorans]|nr:hypothetical protein [Paraburkholderia aromaticivorans]